MGWEATEIRGHISGATILECFLVEGSLQNDIEVSTAPWHPRFGWYSQSKKQGSPRIGALNLLVLGEFGHDPFPTTIGIGWAIDSIFSAQNRQVKLHFEDFLKRFPFLPSILEGDVGGVFKRMVVFRPLLSTSMTSMTLDKGIGTSSSTGTPQTGARFPFQKEGTKEQHRLLWGRCEREVSRKPATRFLV